jgi:hypothetical protein
MILRASDITALQHFLMDAARRYVVPGGGALDAQDDLLASAAALDYALLLSVQNGGDSFDDTAPGVVTLRDTMTRAAAAALDFSATMLAAREDLLDDFVDRHAGSGGLFDVLRSLRRGRVLQSDDIGFRALTLANDLRERRERG